MTALRRNACPSLADPMPTGDGLLVRLALTGTMALESFAAICDAARRKGSGIIEITGRGSLQIRGLSEASAARFAARVASVDIEPADAVTAAPLAGLDEAGIDMLANAVRQALRTNLLLLGPKVSVVVDGASALHLDAIAADMRLRLAHDEHRVHLALGGDAASAVPIGAVDLDHAIDAALKVLAVIAARGRQARARDIIQAEGAGVFRAALSEMLIAIPAPPPRAAAEPIGVHALRNDTSALGIGLAFGHAEATALETLTRAAASAGAHGLRASPGRALLVIGVKDAPALAAAADRLGFIVRADDPRRRIIACAGAPLCASALMPTRALGPALVPAAALLRGASAIHLSACRKGCAHQGAAALTVVGGWDGCDVIVNGSTGDAPLLTVASDALAATLARLARADTGHARALQEVGHE